MSRDIVGELAALEPEGRMRVLGRIEIDLFDELQERWTPWANAGQLEPPGDWRVWLIRAGRGFGKTRAGAEWISQFARDHPGARIALVGGSAHDAAKVMIEGASGLVAVARRDEAIVWRREAAEVRFPSGAVARVFSAVAYEQLRGPEHHAAWCDELAKWKTGQPAWDNLLMGLRLGPRPRVLVTTTPRANALMRRIMATKGLVETRGRTWDNPHLPADYLSAMADIYGATRLGRQELDGEMIDDIAGALWTRAMIERARTAVACDPVRVVVGVDPPAGSGGDACGIVAAAIDGDGLVHVLEDASVAGASPEGWARAVAGCAARHGADRVVAEVNQGGDMVESVMRAADV
ncbi:MAG TPA: terminase family protein, partial [Sphingomonas sp.]|nr:terminase family protein [Sphingomonas sp.]